MCQVESGNPNINLDFATIASFLGEDELDSLFEISEIIGETTHCFTQFGGQFLRLTFPVICFGIMKCYSVEGGVFSPQAHRISRKNWRAVDEVK